MEKQHWSKTVMFLAVAFVLLSVTGVFLWRIYQNQRLEAERQEYMEQQRQLE